MTAEPFYFGRREHLFGFYHPATQMRRDHGVVICPPLLNEYMRSHHALRRIAITLADRGYDVLRFDFSGQGNSAGSMSDVTCTDWDGDVADALQEIKSIAGVERVSVVATRFACSLVAKQSQLHELRNFVCWDPIFDGAEWYGMLLRVQRKLKSESRAPDAVREHEYMGHETSSDFVGTLQRYKHSPADAGDVLVVQTAEASRVTGHPTVVVRYNCRWEEMSSQVLYPREVIEALCRPFS
jgi:esterase/lipase